jgi:hypothetical protein
MKNDQTLHHKNMMAVVNPLLKISYNAILHCYTLLQVAFYSHLAPRNRVLHDKILLYAETSESHRT